MDLETIYENVERRGIRNTTGSRTQTHGQDEKKDLKHRGSRCLVLMTVSLGLICVLLLVFIILQHITITAERDLMKSYKNISSLNQQKLELESKVTSLSLELNMDASEQVCFFMSSELKSWSDSRQYCRDRGADLVIINSEEKQRFISSFTKERVWIGLSDREQEGNMTWVDNSTLKKGFWFKGEPNDYGGNEDCIEMNYETETLNSWNDCSCSDKKKGICEK